MGFFNDLGRGILDTVTLGGYSANRTEERNDNINNLIMSREDNAYQRTVADMNKAGLNPLTMNGINGSGALTNETGDSDSMNKLMNLATVLSGTAKTFKEIGSIGVNDNLVNSQTEGQKLANKLAVMQNNRYSNDNKYLSKYYGGSELQMNVETDAKAMMSKALLEGLKAIGSGIGGLFDKKKIDEIPSATSQGHDAKPETVKDKASVWYDDQKTEIKVNINKNLRNDIERIERMKDGYDKEVEKRKLQEKYNVDYRKARDVYIEKFKFKGGKF